ncbi:hypothetical protein A2U01_0112179, partial [Trifolium medium]|nr:hypothetical protein [Trifolium medium]
TGGQETEEQGNRVGKGGMGRTRGRECNMGIGE